MHGRCACGTFHHPQAQDYGATAGGGRGETIQTLVYTGAGVEWRERAKPHLQGAGEAIVRPLAATTCDLDQHIIRGLTPYTGGFSIGHEAVGEVVEVGEAVKTVAVGDLVSIPYHLSCGVCDRCLRGLTANCRDYPGRPSYGLPINGDWGGLFDDLVRVPNADGMLVRLPEGVAPEVAVSASDNLSIGWEVTVDHLRETPGARVLVVGGVRSIGLYAADFARAFGASEVIYCDTSPRRLAIAEALGVTPYEGLPGDAIGSFDLSIDASCEPEGLRRAIVALEPEAACESVGIYFADVPFPTFAMYARSVRFRTGRGNSRRAMPEVLRMVQAGKVRPDLVNSVVRPWACADEELGETDKPVFTRPPRGVQAISA